MECGDEVEEGDHENTFDGTIEIGKEQNSSMIFFPGREIKVT